MRGQKMWVYEGTAKATKTRGRGASSKGKKARGRGAKGKK